MKLHNKHDTTHIRKLVKDARNFEITLSDTIQKSEQRAWIVAGAASGLAVILAMGYMFVLPLKEKIPYLVMADPFTGSSSIARLNDDFHNASITSSEAINKSNVARFVTARESYDWDLIGRRDWNIVNAMSASSVASEYIALFNSNNPLNPDTIYGQSKSLRIRIKTIILKGAESGKPPTSAEVRFDRLVINKQAARIESADSKIASIAFEYSNNLKMKEELRVENPLGFRVTSYRVDPDSTSINVSALQLAPTPPQTQPAATPVTSATVNAPAMPGVTP
ncbi:virB8 family protein [Leeia oryzae]|uniref:virB8 family protein n=1 Tax=Leeia oryzae TaxID=356662 RepID=UPI0003705D26|nr:type IV secretion system protein [Leeia oryzae]